MAHDERLNMTLNEAVYSLRAIRRQKPDPIPDEDIQTILDAAIQAPNGGNMQPWHFLVVTDAALRAEFAPLYHEAWWAKRNDSGWYTPDDLPDAYKGAMQLADEIGNSPALIFVCALAKGPAAANSIIPSVREARSPPCTPKSKPEYTPYSTFLTLPKSSTACHLVTPKATLARSTASRSNKSAHLTHGAGTATKTHSCSHYHIGSIPIHPLNIGRPRHAGP